ncbi:MAG: 2-C-methyl-D-erythritol 2,4-cyclodiphosphate synthase [Actinomycetota bacterium]|nr:2-C-methyl-D-erythritol 2,4-cyclodiphosphate synthase [Actinomycetota bacterium]
MSETRVGIGFDVHPRDDSRTLRLGGVAFGDEPGLAGHSDGDVVCHALADAFLGAAALGDLGDHFPDTDPEIAGIAGPDLLKLAVRVLEEAGFQPDSCDVVLLAERPRIADRRDEIRGGLASALGLEPPRVSVKATRPEGLGLSGDGAACFAVATVRRG